jgi:hypothetical protein
VVILAKGWTAIEQQEEALNEQRAQFGKQSKPMLVVNPKNPGPFTIRFLEQGDDVNNYGVHEYTILVGNEKQFRRFTCLKEAPWNAPECPGCSAGMKLKRRGVYNVIQRGRPIIRRGSDNKPIIMGGQYIVDGYQDTVVIANVGGLTAGMLRKADGNYRGLMSRDFVVQFSGDTFQAWTLSPAINEAGDAVATPLSDADRALMAAKHDLDEFMKPPSVQEAAQIVARYGGNSGASQLSPAQQGAGAGIPSGVPPQAANNPLLAGMTVPPGTNPFGQVTGAPAQPAQQQPQTDSAA